MKIHTPETIATACEASRLKILGAKIERLDYAKRVLIAVDINKNTYIKRGAEFDKITTLAEHHAQDINGSVQDVLICKFGGGV